MEESQKAQSLEERQEECFNNYISSEDLIPIERFDDERLGLKTDILRGIFSYGYEKPSPIQKIGIKPITEGKDIVLQSHSGTGKTCTFLTGMLQVLQFEEKSPQALILANTKELIDQIQDVLCGLSRYCDITHTVCTGGDLGNRYVDDEIQEQVIIGTPGRVCDMIHRRILPADRLKLLIIDEADEVLSSGFRKQVKNIIRSLSKDCQIVLVSATIPDEMSQLVTNILRPDYVSILVDDGELQLKGISQYYIPLDESDKMEVLLDIYRNLSIGQGVIYCNKKDKADELKMFLDEQGYPSGILHGNLLPSERKKVINDFRRGMMRVLITTDVMARGVDIQQISLVINYDMPKYVQTYIHRIGRSGRYGRKGVAINFVTRRERNILTAIERKYNVQIPTLPENLNQVLTV
jgi:translation initiation factor 4A